jgi:hypothetical protein
VLADDDFAELGDDLAAAFGEMLDGLPIQFEG